MADSTVPVKAEIDEEALLGAVLAVISGHAVVKPGETLVIRLKGWGADAAEDYQEYLDARGLPFGVLVVVGDELAVAENESRVRLDVNVGGDGDPAEAGALSEIGAGLASERARPAIPGGVRPPVARLAESPSAANDERTGSGVHYFSEPEAPTATWCRKCGRWFLPGDALCDIEHEGSGCCHLGDTEIPDPPAGTAPGLVGIDDAFGEIAGEIEALARRVADLEAETPVVAGPA